MNQVTLAMIGAGRATELHMEALKMVHTVTVRPKIVMARRVEQLEQAKRRWGFEQISTDFDEVLNDPDVDVVDICTPPYVHAEMVKKALLAGKHVICEKPLTGYFGEPGDPKPIGKAVPKKLMFERLKVQLNELEEIMQNSKTRFMYAENFIYAPSVTKAAEIISSKKSRVLFMKGEESLKGSSSKVAGEWSKTGGGTFIRTGTHPLSALLWIKMQEARARGTEIRVKSITADMGQVTNSLSDYEHRHIAARPVDVEDQSCVIIEFTDGARAVVMATDTCLGGSQNYIELYCNDANLKCQITMNNLMSSYMLDENGMDKVYLSEMLPGKTGWNYPFISDEIIRGYVAEMQDFMECIYFDRDPLSGFELARDTTLATYAAYMSADEGKKIVLR